MSGARLDAPSRLRFRCRSTEAKLCIRRVSGPSGSGSPIFNAQMPPENFFGLDEATVPELLLSPSAEQGYYLFLYPLSPGPHRIRWVASGCTPDGFQDITYNLTVAN